MNPSPELDRTVATITRLLGEVVGEDYLLDVEIGPATSFADDIELESIDLVALTEQLEIAYGPEVDFTAWIAAKELDEIISLTVGDLAEFIIESTGGRPVPVTGTDPVEAPA